jgi:hypothetical protein
MFLLRLIPTAGARHAVAVAVAATEKELMDFVLKHVHKDFKQGEWHPDLQFNKGSPLERFFVPNEFWAGLEMRLTENKWVDAIIKLPTKEEYIDKKIKETIKVSNDLYDFYDTLIQVGR